MKHYIRMGLLVFATLLFGGCSTDNAMQEASQVSNLNEVDFSVFEKTLDELPTRSVSSRADESSSVPLSETNLFTELEVALIPVDDTDNLKYSVRQLSTEDKFGETKLYVPAGDYYLVAVAANTKNPVKDHQITIKSTTEVDFPNGIVTDMAYSYQKVTIGAEKSSRTISLKRGVSAFKIESTDRAVANSKTYEITINKGVGSVFDPSTGFCAKEEKYVRTFDLTGQVGRTMSFTVFVLLPKAEEKDASITVKSIDTSDNIIKSLTFDDVHLVCGKRTVYQGPLFTPTSSVSFTIAEGNIEDADDVHEFD